MKIDWKKEISMPKLRRPSIPKLRREAGEKASRRPSGPDLHVPKPLADLYWDLRDRHLLPVVGLLIVAMIAAPILLSNKGGKEEEAPAIATAPAGAGQASDATFTVVPAGSSLRDYKKRLGHREAINPFRRSNPAAQASSSDSGSEAGSQETSSGQESDEASGGSEEAVSGTTETSESVVTTTVGGVTKEVPGGAPEPTERGHDEVKGGNESEGGPKPEETSPTKPKQHHESGGGEKSEGADTPTPSEPAKPAEPTHTEASEGSSSGSQEAQAPQVVVGYTIDAVAGFLPHSTEKTEIAPMTRLPNAKHPVIVFMGLSQNHKRALFLMTGEVTAWYGGHCALDKQACQLVEVGPGKAVTFAYGYGDSRYKVQVRKIVPTLMGRRASSGR